MRPIGVDARARPSAVPRSVLEPSSEPGRGGRCRGGAAAEWVWVRRVVDLAATACASLRLQGLSQFVQAENTSCRQRRLASCRISDELSEKLEALVGADAARRPAGPEAGDRYPVEDDGATVQVRRLIDHRAEDDKLAAQGRQVEQLFCWVPTQGVDGGGEPRVAVQAGDAVLPAGVLHRYCGCPAQFVPLLHGFVAAHEIEAVKAARFATHCDRHCHCMVGSVLNDPLVLVKPQSV